MIALIIGIVVSLVITMIGTPTLIRVVHKLHYGQYIRQDGPQSHQVKRGTPTLGGVVIVLAVLLGWGASALYRYCTQHIVPSWSAVLTLFAMASMGLLGFIDDFAKVRKKQNEGLTVKGKFIGQFILATIYAVLALMLPTKSGFPSAQAGMSFIETPFLSFDFAGRFLAIVLFVIWVNFLMAAWTNAVNLTDGLDGLCAGSSMVAFAGYGIIAFWESYHLRGSGHPGFTYAVSDPFDLTIIACCAAVACLGFLWYNCNPASIFMGDTGSLALGGLFAAMSIATHTEFLAIILGGLFVIETLSDIIQVGYFKMTHKRVFKMAPIHHHFELCGWTEGKVVVRFWMVELLFVIIGLMIFYADWVVRSGL
ncbi:phospho-N-acetylmuramoyl-pentapeptide-transferase [Bifidobacterium pseudolongum]|uniref:Phospho-N-acetylmuramoyl-pentapeptide-transferase n=1 Tax=Bifidobacterium pseudolongum subsp. pseudolongum TaxID=31954 RepID=A0A4Q5A731_9BIFI|nr:phospho-N-acetylmuramoyl-pentapeptide-transferase [Bifidobacterium pseudolongum]KFI80049.1 phospho-N-acetylmuramoyl-pentapeptide-transferas e [Bifidobacterium pseudolongum subsp. pseudolongum]MDY3689901.1 phospho-N-acetylmuramoyl-pentapeptide-transferase [Bifidobacterium pseudolongum]PKU99279.1 phospho-N-acetylmuramoyl-pentapeptide- transferas e [Bifidobacterium pseudolongum subsp. pseudolongum]PKV07526.1 phospho-N-acetylmuramoyl-pentapeptide-transferas e [Bifidobacterium pseudolongum subsp.